MTTLSTTPLHSTVLEEARAAPTRPPIRACEEDEGSPKYQVTRFHAIAPTRPAKMIVVVTAVADTIPWATVAATLSDMKAPTKFRIAAKPTANRGDMARVEMEVATT